MTVNQTEDVKDIVRLSRSRAVLGQCDSAEDAIHYRRVFSRPTGFRPSALPCQYEEEQCDNGLRSVYHEEMITIDGEEKRLVVTNGIPSHQYHNFTGTER